MLASPWEKQDAKHEGVKFLNNLLPESYKVSNDRLEGLVFDPLDRLFDDEGRWAPIKSGAPPVTIACDDVILAIGQSTYLDFVDKDSGVVLDERSLPSLNDCFQSNVDKVFFGGDCGKGPKNIITAVADGHKAALSIKLFLEGKDPTKHPPWESTLTSQKMGLHEWSFGNAHSNDPRFSVPELEMSKRFGDLSAEVELGFSQKAAELEADRCLNCDVQTVFTEDLCIECDACVDICPTDCLTIASGQSSSLPELTSERLEEDQQLFISDFLKTNSQMIKDENVCLHCSLCAERCPTGAWDMQKFELQLPYASDKGTHCSG